MELTFQTCVMEWAEIRANGKELTCLLIKLKWKTVPDHLANYFLMCRNSEIFERESCSDISQSMNQ